MPMISQELIEKAAKALCREEWKNFDREELSKSDHDYEYWMTSARESLTAILPDIRRQVLESAELEALRLRDELKAQANKLFEEGDQGSAILVRYEYEGLDKFASRLRSLMEKEE